MVSIIIDEVKNGYVVIAGTETYICNNLDELLDLVREKVGVLTT